MLKITKIEAKNKDDALNKALEAQNVRSDETYYYFDEIEGGLFKGKKYCVNLVTKYDVKKFLKDFLNDLAYRMNTKFDIEVKESEVGFSIVLISDDNAALIGKDGKTLNSIQTILRQAIKCYGNFDFKINLDVSDYKARRENRIIREAKKICREVRKTKMDVTLDPMNSYDRRLFHNVACEYDHVVSHSEGEGKERHVIISYEE